MVVFIIYKFKSVWKIEKMFSVMIWAWPGAIVVWVGFKPTAPHASLTQNRGEALRRVPTGPTSCRLIVANVRGWDHSFSLSSAYKKEKASRSFLPRSRFSPNTKVRPTSAHHRLAADWSDHCAIPFA
jgi:hypothetical protein